MDVSRFGYEGQMSIAAGPADRTSFATELRSWRTRRRWSQLELAVRAGTTQRHLSFVEQGRSKPGRQLILRLAESLELSLRERNALLGSAGYAAVFVESPLDAEVLRPVRDALDTVLVGHLPFPAVAVRAHGTLVSANAAFALLTDGADPSLLQPPINVLRLALHPDGVAPRVVNLPEWGRHIVDSLRARAARSPSAELDRLVAELEGYLPPTAPGPDHVGFAVPLRLRLGDGELRLISTLTSFATAVDVTVSELALEAFLPADGSTAAALADLEQQRLDTDRPPLWSPPTG